MTLAEAIAALRYPPEWLQFGLLEREFVMRQAETFATGEDRNTEHYRYAAFRALLGRRARNIAASWIKRRRW
jgi:hypothetical protein